MIAALSAKRGRKTICKQYRLIVSSNLVSKGELTRDELVAKAIEALENTSYKEMGEMLQVEKDTNEWHCFGDDGEEINS